MKTQALKNVRPFYKKGVKVLNVRNEDQAVREAKEILYKIVDKDTIIFLSGGSTPKNLYEELARDKRINPGAVSMVDERYGTPYHSFSNEKMIDETGFLKYLSSRQIPFFPILKKGKTRQETVIEFDKRVRKLLNKFQKKVSILGIGEDGHTAGIAPDRKDFKNPIFRKDKVYVGDFDDGQKLNEGGFGERITLAFRALSQMDLMLVLVLGKKKRKALRKMFSTGKIESVPARWYTNKEIAKKTILIEDQQV